ncbi:hypothetical protein HYFRA_00008132 [Hymenoscyphus fraxineus]|uniref:Uncharacterized protein n=1 Tax=Hymenoscyphus fraxineus TaxID=746836 RepID=A0A9N9L7A7_9HELO|nr:hypothetical protein HYFRA_00008132 [Hymenoscyphus fraxineus]
MSTSKIALATLTGAGALLAVNSWTKPSRTHSIANGMRHQLDDYNSRIHPEQEKSDTMMDRTRLMEDAKQRKPWNMTLAEREQSEK